MNFCGLSVVDSVMIILKSSILWRCCLCCLCYIVIVFSVGVWIPPKLVFQPCFLKIVVEVKALLPLHVLKLWFGISMRMLRHFCPNKAIILYQLNFMEIIRLLQRWGKIWPFSVLGILPDLKQWCMSVLVVTEGYTQANRYSDVQL